MSSHYFSNRIFFNFKSIKFHCKSSIFINSKLRFHFTHAKKKFTYIHFLLFFIVFFGFSSLLSSLDSSSFFDFFVVFFVAFFGFSSLLSSLDSLLSLSSLLSSSDSSFFDFFVIFFGFSSLDSLSSLSSLSSLLSSSDSSFFDFLFDFSFSSLHYLIASFKSDILVGIFPSYNFSSFIYFNNAFNSVAFISSKSSSFSSSSSDSSFFDFFDLDDLFLIVFGFVNSSFSIF